MNELQSCLLKMLLDIDSATKKGNVQYFLNSGTALGAIRHGGFIPWDDDTDIMISKKDVTKFIDAMKKYLPTEKYTIQNPMSLDWPYMYYKIRLNNSSAIEKNNVNSRAHQGLWIDIFIAEDVSESKTKQKITYFLLKSISSLQSISLRTTGIKKLTYFQKMIHQAIKFLNKMIDFITEKDTKLWMNRGTNNKTLYDKKFIHCSENVVFEGHVFPTHFETEEYLTKTYGNYMELPPEDERKSDHIFYFNPELDYKTWISENKSIKKN